MNEKIPTKFLKLKTLIELPRAKYRDGPKPSDLRHESKRKSFLSMLRKKPSQSLQTQTSKQMSKLTFNVAAWIRVPKSSKQLISAVISYKDLNGEYSIVVDEDLISDGFSLMLTGCVTIETKGVPEFIKICVAGLKEAQIAIVDDLYVEKTNEVQQIQHKKIA